MARLNVQGHFTRPLLKPRLHSKTWSQETVPVHMMTLVLRLVLKPRSFQLYDSLPFDVAWSFNLKESLNRLVSPNSNVY